MALALVLLAAIAANSGSPQIISKDGDLVLINAPGAKLRAGPSAYDTSEVITKKELDIQLAALEERMTKSCKALIDANTALIDVNTAATEDQLDRISTLESCQHKNGFVLADGSCAELPRPFEQATADDLANSNCGNDNSGRGVIFEGKLYVCDGSQGDGEWLQLPEAPLGSSEKAPAADCNDIQPRLRGKYFVGAPGSSVQVFCDTSTDAAGNSVLLNRGGDGSSKESVAASCGTIVSLWNIKKPSYYYVHTVVQKGVEKIVRVNCDGKGTSGGDGKSARSYAASCSVLDDHFFKLPDGKYWVATDTAPRLMGCLRNADDGKMYEVPDGLSKSAAAASCAAIKADYPDMPTFQDSYLKSKSGAISVVRCLTLACDRDGVAAKGTSAEMKCPNGAKFTANAVSRGDTKATATPNCLLFATAYPTTSTGPYWIAPVLSALVNKGGTVYNLGNCEGDCDNDSDCQGDHLKCFQRDKSIQQVPGCAMGGPGENESHDYCHVPGAAIVAELKECVITRTGFKVTAVQMSLLGTTKERPAASCAAIGILYKSWGTEKSGVYWIGSKQKNCLFTADGIAEAASDGKSADSAFVSCNDAFSVVGKSHLQNVGNVWVKPHGSVQPFQTACQYMKVHGSGVIEGWSLFAMVHTSNRGWPRTNEPNNFMQFGTGRGSEGLKTGEMVQQSQPTAHGWPRWGEYMRTKGTKGMTMFEYLSQGGGCGGGSICGGAKKNRKKSIWYKEAGPDVTKSLKKWFQRQDNVKTKSCINRAMTVNCRSSTTYSGGVISPKHSIVCDKCTTNPDTCGWGNGCWEIGDWHARFNYDGSPSHSGFCSSTGGNNAKWPDYGGDGHWGNGLRLFVL